MQIIKKIVLFLFVIVPILVCGQNKKIITKTTSSFYYDFPYKVTKSCYYDENDSVVLHGKLIGDINYNTDGRICKYHEEKVFKDGALDGMSKETLTLDLRSVTEYRRGEYFTASRTQSYSGTTYHKEGKKVGTWNIKYKDSEYNDISGKTESSGEFTLVFNNDQLVGYSDGRNDFRIDENGLVSGTLYMEDVGTFTVSKGIVTDKFIRLTKIPAQVSEDDVMAKVVSDVVSGDTEVLKGGHYSSLDVTLNPFWEYENAKFPEMVGKWDINTYTVDISFVRKAKLLTLDQAKEQMNIYYGRRLDFPDDDELLNKLTFEEVQAGHHASSGGKPWLRGFRYVNISKDDALPLKNYVDSLKNERAEEIRRQQQRLQQEKQRMHQEELKIVDNIKQSMNKMDYGSIWHYCNKYHNYSGSGIYINNRTLSDQYKDSILAYLDNVRSRLETLDSLENDIKKRKAYYIKSYPQSSYALSIMSFWALDTLLCASAKEHKQDFTMEVYDEYYHTLLRQEYLYQNYERYVFLWESTKKSMLDYIKVAAGKDYRDVVKTYSKAISMKRKVLFGSFNEFVQYAQLCQSRLQLTLPCEVFISQRREIDSIDAALTLASSRYKHIAKSYKKYYSSYDKSWTPSIEYSNSLDSLAIFQDSCFLFVSLNDEINNIESQILSKIQTQKLNNVKKAYFKCKDTFALLNVPPASSEQLRSFIGFQKIVERNLSGESSNIIDSNLKKAKNVEEMKLILTQ